MWSTTLRLAEPAGGDIRESTRRYCGKHGPEADRSAAKPGEDGEHPPVSVARGLQPELAEQAGAGGLHGPLAHAERRGGNVVGPSLG